MKNAERNALLEEVALQIAHTTSLPEAQAVIRAQFGTGGDDEEWVKPEEEVAEEDAETPEGDEGEVTAEEQEEPEGEDPEDDEAEEPEEGQPEEPDDE